MHVAVSKGVRGVGLGAASTLIVVAASGCSVKRYENPDLVRGKQLFVAKCGACHTLARASTKGVVGPNLDDAFRNSLAVGEGRGTIDGVVHFQINDPNPGGAMPKGLITNAQEVEDVAAYVAYAADRPGQDPGLLGTAVAGANANAVAVEKAGTLSIDANPNGLLAYTAAKATATAGNVTIDMKNMSAVDHNIALQQGANGAILKASPIIGHGGSTSLTLSLKPGTYTYFCQVPGHRAAGMLGTLTVK